jgi:hypothetical protein
MFRGDLAKSKDLHVDELKSTAPKSDSAPTVDEIFASVSRDRLTAAKQVLAYLKSHPDATDFINAARRLVFLKGNNSHDYKFSSAVLEDYAHLSPECRDHYVAASVFNLRGSGDKDNDLVKRTREALKV